MKGLILRVPDEELARRRQTGIDRYDEMWEGVLHMGPAPAYEHQRLVGALYRFLGHLCDTPGRGILAMGINVFGDAATTQNYRIPDLTFVAAGREHIVAADGIRGGGPDAVIEVRSPDDESYEKFPFFARLGVREVIIVDRDSKDVDLYRLAGSEYVSVARGDGGWLRSEVLDVRFGRAGSQLAIEDCRDRAAGVQI